MSVEMAKLHILQAKQLGVKQVVLNGGEPLSYPFLSDLLEYLKSLNLGVVIYTSGLGISGFLDEYTKKKLNFNICLSLNGSTESVNALSRDGYKYTIKAMELLQLRNLKYSIVWVARKDNLHDFINLIDFANKHNAENIFITLNRYNGNGVIESQMDDRDLNILREIIQNYDGKANIKVDLCFGELLKLMGKKTLYCPAGRLSYSVTIDGYYRPCTHVNVLSSFSKPEEYWNTLSNIKPYACLTNHTWTDRQLT